MDWYCIYTKHGQADNVYRRLITLPDIEVFKPRLRTKRFIRGRYQELIEDLFPCYMFLRFDLIRYYRALRYTRGVKRIVGDSSGIPYTVDPSIIEFIPSREKDGYISIEVPELYPGDRVVVKDGPLKGLAGIFVKETKPKERVLILLSTIAYQARMEIDSDLLVPA